MARQAPEAARLRRVARGALLVGATILGFACKARPPDAASPAAAGPSAPQGCTGNAIEVNGRRHLALIVGVGKYRSPSVRSLVGPPNDARSMQALLTGRYGFPPENVCVLVDEQATTEAFRASFERALVARARPSDVAVLFFAGHGSQAPDTNGDEPDGWDETLLFHDARSDGVQDLVDDELNALLARLHEKTQNIVVILDSCNSGTATRDADAGTFVARFQPPAGARPTALEAGATAGARDPWVPASMRGVVVLTAAADGTSALETDGHGIFTDALVQILGQAANAPVTYAQAARQIPPVIAARSPQIPYFQGDLDREVFGTEGRARPLAWEVRKAGPVLEIAGPPMPGLGKGAELRVYAPGLGRAEFADPAKAKAMIVVDEATGLNAKARVAAAPQGAPAPAAGDLAILVRPADQSLRVSVRLRPEREPGGIPRARADALRAAIAGDADARAVVEPTEGPGDFELALAQDGRLQLRGPENRIRNVLPTDAAVPRALWRHARQKALRFLRGEGGADYADDRTLQVEVRPAPAQKPCAAARLGDWSQSAPNQEQVVPLCVAWNIRVSMSRDAPNAPPLLVGGVVLSTDGATLGFPEDGQSVLLRPGESHTFPKTYYGRPPLDVQDAIRVFGTQQTNPVAWSSLTEDVRSRSARPPRSALHRALDRYLTPGARGVGEDAPAAADTTWTASTLALRVEANLRFLEPAPDGKAAPRAREYTIPRFDVRPYLPDDEAAALRRVLVKADALARTQVGYKQHDWKGATDAANLSRGIDCSRAIWFAFTRAGLRYSGTDAYLTTAEMVAERTSMKDEFDRCDGSAGPQLGDVLVYRDDERGDGHVVMVIDAAKRIGWGSHGWDGNARELGIEPQTGVEYQRIKYKPDWDRWDRNGMRLKACWRYRRFAEEAAIGRGLPGTRALGDDPCDASSCPAARSAIPLDQWGAAPARP